VDIDDIIPAVWTQSPDHGNERSVRATGTRPRSRSG
jgi:hypothetical protein